MKNTKLCLSFMVIFALLFTSCSKDEEPVKLDSEKATLSFGAVVQDLANKAASTKQAVGDEEIPACSEDAPAFVEIVLMQGDAEVVGTAEEPYRVDLVDGQVFTEEDAELELVPGTYTLDHFSVYNADGELLWVAPRSGSTLAQFVERTLPMDINLGAGVKKYVDVPVLCYDDRNVNEYGYQFFEFDTTKMYEYCFFANYCDGTDRHFPARISVEVEIDGVVLYSGEQLVSGTGVDENGDFYAEPVCFAIPDLAEYGMNEEYVDYTVTLLDWDENYGDVTQEVITGSLSRAEIMANHGTNNEVEYEHLRFGCGETGGEEPVDTDNDGVANAIDECPDTAPGVEVDNVGCPVEVDADNDGVVDSEDLCPDTAEGVNVDQTGCPVEQCIPAPAQGCENLEFNEVVDLFEGLPVGEDPFYPLYLGGERIGTITFALEGTGDTTMDVSVDLYEGWTASDVEVSLPEFVNTEICVRDINENDFNVVYEVDPAEFPEGLNYPLEVEFNGNVCFE